ncbi:glutaminase [Marinicella rhabdoformis]|uniref:glutaminase n=1 Tax=Marinicella rhabdoformis TaxID=2580566 RepID=UPI0012AEDAF0|nr:glutaminase [Marinicella rhabdoformis]
MNYQQAINKVYQTVLQGSRLGEAADYIPELARVDADQMGVYLHHNDLSSASAGAWDQNFSIQSVVKVLTLSMAYQKLGSDIWHRVGVEPSGTPFNSLGHLEHEQGVPRNPFSNAGALVVCDVLLDLFDDPRAAMLQMIRESTGNPVIDVNKSIADSEKSEGFRNVALANLIKSLGNIKHDVNELLDLYFDCCSITLNCKDLALLFSFLANQGTCVQTGKALLTPSQTKRINAIMLTCGFYDEAGQFAYKIGLPGKSGVSGAIVAVMPNVFSLAIWSPGLNIKGNSQRGIEFLEGFTNETGQSIF